MTVFPLILCKILRTTKENKKKNNATVVIYRDDCLDQVINLWKGLIVYTQMCLTINLNMGTCVVILVEIIFFDGRFINRIQILMLTESRCLHLIVYVWSNFVLGNLQSRKIDTDTFDIIWILTLFIWWWWSNRVTWLLWWWNWNNSNKHVQ